MESTAILERVPIGTTLLEDPSRLLLTNSRRYCARDVAVRWKVMVVELQHGACSRGLNQGAFPSCIRIPSKPDHLPNRDGLLVPGARECATYSARQMRLLCEDANQRTTKMTMRCTNDVGGHFHKWNNRRKAPEVLEPLGPGPWRLGLEMSGTDSPERPLRIGDVAG